MERWQVGNQHQSCLTLPKKVCAGTKRSFLELICSALRIELSIRPDLIHKLVPQSAEAKLLERGIDVNNFQPLSAES